jgi:hypothetical protein
VTNSVQVVELPLNWAPRKRPQPTIARCESICVSHMPRGQHLEPALGPVSNATTKYSGPDCPIRHLRIQEPRSASESPTNPVEPTVNSNFKILHSTHHSQKRLRSHPLKSGREDIPRSHMPCPIPESRSSDIRSPSTTFHNLFLSAPHSSMHLAVSPTNHTAATSPTRSQRSFRPLQLA